MSLVLVTGATGFIGRHFLPQLIARGHRVRATFRIDPSSEDFPAGIDWVQIGEIGPDTDWSAALANVDYVIHLAAMAHQISVRKKGMAQEFLRVNTDGTRRLAQAIADSPSVSRLVFVSSVGAVRSLLEETMNDCTPCEPSDDYGRSKRAAELAVEEVLRNSRADWCIIRPPLVYGPGNPGNMARLQKLINTGVPLPFAGICNKRSFVFVGNLVDAITHCMTHPGASRHIFFVSDGESLSTPELVRRLAKQGQKQIRLFSLPIWILKGLGKIGDMKALLFFRFTGLDTYSVERLIGSLAVDASSLRRATGWQPAFSMDEGIAYTLTERTVR